MLREAGGGCGVTSALNTHAVDWAGFVARDPEQAIPDGMPGLWWVAHTKPRCEKLLAVELLRRDVTVYLPLCWRSSVSPRTRRRSRSLAPAFPGYAFFCGGEDARLAALTTNRLASVLAVVDQARLVDDLRQVQRVLRVGRDVETGPAVQVGEWVRVAVGPLCGLVGRVAQRLNRFRLAINVDILAQSVRVEVPREWLERASAPNI